MATKKVLSNFFLRKENNIILVISAILILIVIADFMLSIDRGDNNFYKAYISLQGDCYNLKEKEGYILAGQVTAGNVSIDGNNVRIISDEIKIDINIQDPEVIRHELCHLHQLLQNRSYSCNFPIGVYFNELECCSDSSKDPLTDKEKQELYIYSR